jgi:phosphonate transport system ATP-binding protein
VSVRLDGVGAAHPGGGLILKGLELNIEAGERVAVIGPSGAGKTSLLRLLATSLPPANGAVHLLNSNPSSLSGRSLKQLRSRIGLIHQSPPLPARQRVVTAVSAGRLGRWSTLRALASLCYPLDISGVRSALTSLDLEDKLFERCDQLSGGQLQRVGIARVLYQQAELILADEPNSTTLVASLHAVDLALRHFPRIIGLRGGRILFDRPTSQVSDDDLQALYANASLSAELAPPAGAALQPAPYPIRRVAPRCL